MYIVTYIIDFVEASQYHPLETGYRIKAVRMAGGHDAPEHYRIPRQIVKHCKGRCSRYDKAMSDLTQKKCIPCTGNTPPLSKSQIEEFKKELTQKWTVVDDPPTKGETRPATLGGKKIRHQFKLDSFASAIEFVNKIAKVAEVEDHHPDITINYNKVTIELTTHAVGGLSENDFIMAAKIEKLV
ncbi:MAG: 4a-hydroxytetrahydrobiopterin dehydratase [Candidatus Andersenbacteria bacterium]|nr:4a-hydroxytetrahydrobiopterin dehydratase [Candidatus Andersenbacteria bacterium]